MSIAVASPSSPALPSQTQDAAPTFLPPPTLIEILSSFSSHGNNDRELLLSILAAKQAEDERLAREWKYRAQMLVAWAKGNGLVPQGQMQQGGGVEGFVGAEMGGGGVGAHQGQGGPASALSPPMSSTSSASSSTSSDGVKVGGKRWSASSSSSSSSSTTSSGPPSKRSRPTTQPQGLAPPSPPASITSSSSSRNNSTSSEDSHTRAMSLVRARLLAARQQRRASESSDEDDANGVASFPKTPEQPSVALDSLVAAAAAVGGKRMLGMGDLLCDGRAGRAEESWVRGE